MHTQTSTVTINASAEQVWAALTEPALVKQWQYGTDITTTWEVGTPISFRNEWDGQVFEQHGTVLKMEPHTLISYSLFAPRPGLEDVPENYFTMSYQLEEKDGSTLLSIIQEDPRPQPEGQSDDDEAGQMVLQALKNLVEQ